MKNISVELFQEEGVLKVNYVQVQKKRLNNANVNVDQLEDYFTRQNTFLHY